MSPTPSDNPRFTYIYQPFPFRTESGKTGADALQITVLPDSVRNDMQLLQRAGHVPPVLNKIPLIVSLHCYRNPLYDDLRENLNTIDLGTKDTRDWQTSSASRNAPPPIPPPPPALPT